MNWEEIDGESISNVGGWKLYRAKIPGGWLVRISDTRSVTIGVSTSIGVGTGAGVTFVPDPEHQWKT